MYLQNKNKSILLAIGELRVYMDPRVYDKTLKIRVRFVCKTCTGTVSAGTGTVSLGPTRSVPVQNPSDSNLRLLTVRVPTKVSNSRVNTRTRESRKPMTRCKGAGFSRGGCGFRFLTHGLPVINPTCIHISSVYNYLVQPNWLETVQFCLLALFVHCRPCGPCSPGRHCRPGPCRI
jgi:hypothetical protein